MPRFPLWAAVLSIQRTPCNLHVGFQRLKFYILKFSPVMCLLQTTSATAQKGMGTYSFMKARIPYVTSKSRLWPVSYSLWGKGEPNIAFYFILFYFILNFLGPHLQYMEIPRLGVKLKLQLLVCTAATSMPDLSCICDLLLQLLAMPGP